MATPARPSTPMAQSAPGTPTTGTWRHPKMDEIIRRQNASSFTSDNVKRILYNVGGIVAVWVVWGMAVDVTPKILSEGRSFLQYGSYAYHAVLLVFLFNILHALLPLTRNTDDLSDIALTPAQRKLLGLPPSSAPPTPGSTYSTPPRYARTPTPRSGSPAARATSGSPLSAKGSPASGNMPSPIFSPGSRALGGLDGSRRASYGSPSPLNPSRPALPETPGTPSPTAPKAGQLGLNSKWLYDKGRRNSGNSRLFG